jgi:hypothetical protein
MPYQVFMHEKYDSSWEDDEDTHWVYCETEQLANEFRAQIEKIWPPNAYRSHNVQEISIINKVETRPAPYPIGFSFLWTLEIGCAHAGPKEGSYAYLCYAPICDNPAFQVIDLKAFTTLYLPEPDALADVRKMTIGETKKILVKTTVIGHTVIHLEDGIFVEKCLCKTEAVI